MIDNILRATALVAALVAALLVVVLIGSIVHMALNMDKYQCEPTGRKVIRMIPSGSATIPVVQDEVSCTRIAE